MGELTVHGESIYLFFFSISPPSPAIMPNHNVHLTRKKVKTSLTFNDYGIVRLVNAGADRAGAQHKGDG